MSGVRAVTYGPDPVVFLHRGEGYEIRVRVRPELVDKADKALSRLWRRLAPILLQVGVQEYARDVISNIHMQADDAPDAEPAPPEPPPPPPKKSGVRRKSSKRGT